MKLLLLLFLIVNTVKTRRIENPAPQALCWLVTHSRGLALLTCRCTTPGVNCKNCLNSSSALVVYKKISSNIPDIRL